MRRGLISWSRAELPEAVLDGRILAAQKAMASTGLDSMVVYTTPSRSAGVSWLTGFVPYWNEGLLVVPRGARPVLISALSNRVRDWIGRNANVAEVRNAPRIGTEAGRIVAALSGRSAIGAVDLPHLPASVIDGLAAEGHTVSDATAVLAGLRAAADPAEIALTARAAAIAHRALLAIDPSGTDAAAAVARLDGEARRLGAEEVYPAVATDLAASRALVRLEGPARLGARSAIRVSLAYKCAWVRMTRTFDYERSRTGRLGAAAEQLADAVAALPRTGPLQRFRSWLVEATRTTLPLEPLAGSIVDEPLPLAAGQLVNVQATIEVDGCPVLVGGPALIGRDDTPSSLLLAPDAA